MNNLPYFQHVSSFASQEKCKRQILDPISTCIKLAILGFKDPGTKLRVIDYHLDFIPNGFGSGFGRLLSGDSRQDTCSLFPVILRYIDAYLKQGNTKEEKMDIGDEGGGMVATAASEDDNEGKVGHNKKKKKKGGNGNSNSNNNHNEQEESRNASSSDKPPPEILTETNDMNTIPLQSETDICFTKEEKMLYMKKIARHAIRGLRQLSKTYGTCNTAIALQYNSVLLEQACEGMFNRECDLPEHLSNMTKTLFNADQAKSLWGDREIQHASDVLDRWEQDMKQNNKSLYNSHMVSLNEIGRAHV